MSPDVDAQLIELTTHPKFKGVRYLVESEHQDDWIKSCPELALVIDHLAKPPIAKHEIDEWSQAFKPLASYPNIHCKLSGLVTEANWTSWQTDDLRPFVDFALESFGTDRLMFGSDYPVCLLAASYDRVLESFQEILTNPSNVEREKIFSRNAARVYRV